MVVAVVTSFLIISFGKILKVQIEQATLVSLEY